MNEADTRKTVFISHHSSQHATARRLKELLGKAGIRGWLAPDDIDPGVTFDQAIVDQVARSDAIILLLCANSDRSRHVKRELMLGEDGGKPIYPVRLENVETRGLAYWLQDYQWIDWFDRDERTVERLIAVIQGQPALTATVPQTPVQASRPRRRTVLAAAAALLIPAVAGGAYMFWPRLAGDDYVIQPGKWMSRRDVIEIRHPELPPEMARQIEQSFENDPNPEECISEEVARAPGVRLFDPDGEGGCTLTSFQMAGGRLSGYLVCPLPGVTDGGVMQITFRGTYTRTNIDLENDITIARPGNMMRLRARDTTTWVADQCSQAR